jgi:hypothetical protein
MATIVWQRDGVGACYRVAIESPTPSPRHLCDLTLYIEGENVEDPEIAPGTYESPIAFRIPSNAPPSISLPHGGVFYQLKVMFDKSSW